MIPYLYLCYQLLHHLWFYRGQCRQCTVVKTHSPRQFNLPPSREHQATELHQHQVMGNTICLYIVLLLSNVTGCLISLYKEAEVDNLHLPTSSLAICFFVLDDSSPNTNTCFHMEWCICSQPAAFPLSTYMHILWRHFVYSDMCNTTPYLRSPGLLCWPADMPS